MRYQDKVLLEYHEQHDSFKLAFDEGYAFPYEAYDTLEIQGTRYYILYLETHDEYPSVSSDRWIALSEVVSFLQNYSSKTALGQKENQALLQLFKTALTRL